MDRRSFIKSLGTAAAAVTLSTSLAKTAAAAVNHAGGAKLPRSQKMPEIVAFPGNYAGGMIVISLRARKLYLTLGEGRAIAYPVAVGKAGKAWTGAARVMDKQSNPAWVPPAEVKRDNPQLPDLIPGGAPNNPMGPRVLVLDRSEIAIHGTTASMRKSIGSAASYGCIRMYNEDIVDLFDRVRVGTPVVAIG
jgi:lipoprotein-anchoring transpeptidase ErfK/SrfK